MTFLKDNRKKEGFKIIGALLPLQTHIHLTLYAVSLKTTKSKIIGQIFDRFLSTNPINEIITRIIQILSYRFIDLNEKGISLEEFREGIQRELQSKGVPKNYIDEILTKIK